MKFLLYKFFETPQYRETFVKGMLFSNKLSFYRDDENKTCGVSDCFENAERIVISDDTHFVQNTLIEHDGELFIQHQVFETKPNNYRENDAFVSFQSIDFNVFCMSTLLFDDDGRITGFNSKNSEDFGQYGVLIVDTHSFLNRVHDSVKENPSVRAITAGFVKYISYDDRNAIQYWSPFNKFDSFSHQQEFRIVFDTTLSGALQYQIGDISKMVLLIEDKKMFYSSISKIMLSNS